jgi:hypothetical protein
MTESPKRPPFKQSEPAPPANACSSHSRAAHLALGSHSPPPPSHQASPADPPSPLHTYTTPAALHSMPKSDRGAQRAPDIGYTTSLRLFIQLVPAFWKIIYPTRSSICRHDLLSAISKQGKQQTPSLIPLRGRGGGGLRGLLNS